MKRADAKRLWLAAILIGAAAAFLVLTGWREPIFQAGLKAYNFFTDKTLLEQWLASFGYWAPLVFMALQVLQVLLAPIPGEATGFIGGYLFGSVYGFFYSTIALTIGSVLNFIIGRVLGRQFIRSRIAPDKLARFDRLIKRQGILVVFLLFVFPGFPKDYLCLFLGVSNLPLRVFVLMAFIGRMPGTLLLSLQGELLSSRKYFTLAVVGAVTLALAWLSYRYKEALYRWVEKINGQGSTDIDDSSH